MPRVLRAFLIDPAARSITLLEYEGGDKPAHPNRIHGHTCGGHSPTYRTWYAMRRRCADPRHKDYKHYGAKGVEVCPRWLESFENFLADMGERPAGKTLDRFPDKTGHYAPGNCRWATQQEQVENTSRNVPLTIFDETKIMSQWARDARCVVTYDDLKRRIRSGWDAEKALTAPIVSDPSMSVARAAGLAVRRANRDRRVANIITPPERT